MHYFGLAGGVLISLGLVGCALVQAQRIDDVVSNYHLRASNVKLGDSKEKVLAVLGPTQEGLEPSERKPSEAFMKEKVITEIFYFRSGRQPDGLTTDDEFTPYVFTEGVLTAIGWATLGGPKSHGQVSSESRGGGGGGIGSSGMVTCMSGPAGITTCH